MAKCDNGGLDQGEAAVEDDGQRRLVDDGVVGWSVARVHQTRVLAEGGVPRTMVPVLDDPMAPVEGQQPLGVGLLRRQRGHAVGDLEGLFSGLDPSPLAEDAENLSDGRVVDQTGQGLQHLDPAFLDAAMGLVVVFREVGSGIPVPIDGLRSLEGLRGVALDREEVVRPVAAANGQGGVPGGVQGVQRDHRTPDIDILQQGADRRDLAPLFVVDAAGDGHGIGVTDQGDGLVVRLLVAVGAAQALAVGGQRVFGG